MKYNIIETGSNGNATVINDLILIDCGVSFKKLSPYYKKLALVLLTHIHSDHFNKKTITSLSKERPLLRFACCSWLVQELVNCGVNKRNIDVLEIGKLYDYKLFKVVPVLLYHNVDNCGYRLFIDKIKIFYATDTNTLEGIAAKDYDIYFVESNYTDDEIKERIRFKVENGMYTYENEVVLNHLSKEKCDKWLLDNIGDHSKVEYMHQHKERDLTYENA